MFSVDHHGPFHAIGRSGSMVIAVMKRPIDAVIVEDLGGVVGRVLAENDNRIAYFQITSLEGGSAADIADVRRHYGALVKRFSGARGVVALVAENEGFTGSLVRSAFTAVMAMARSGLVGKAFAGTPPAIDWLSQAAIVQAVPVVPPAPAIARAIDELRAVPRG